MRHLNPIAAAVAMALVPFATAMAFEEVPPPAGHSLGSVTGGHFKGAGAVIEKRCTTCHSAKVIQDAIAAGKNMQQIQERMELKGVKLSADERSVLGVFWKKSPLKK